MYEDKGFKGKIFSLENIKSWHLEGIIETSEFGSIYGFLPLLVT